MSNLRAIDLKEVDDLVDFVRGRGYVLDFSDASFSQFFASDLDITIDDPVYAEYGVSKGRRLRCLLQKTDDSTAIRVLSALWDYRGLLLLRLNQSDPVPNAEARYLALRKRLSGNQNAAQSAQECPKIVVDPARIVALRDEVVALSKLDPQPRGYAFEVFLRSLFDTYGLKARDAFRNRGEQIDGSFILAGETYLLEAKWQNASTGAAELRAFHGKVEEKAAWTRGLFISHSGFTDDGLFAFGRGKRIICMDGLDLYYLLQRGLALDQVLDRKVRAAAETGHPFMRVRDLFAH
jgi:Restriction endonuclease